MNDAEKELHEKEQEERKAYAEFLGKDSETETTNENLKNDSEVGPIEKELKKKLDKPKGLEFYEILYDRDNDTYTMSRETFNHIRGIE
ncbi:hypothetical protein [Enterococcus faecium]|uniref:hypothetical protein n=1 Tax=Enterococcus faecium TaxID=1352 RepID=UPI000BF21586|nr:hypothetical protein [Enterococcus faecium]PEH49573.1 hypothetical protein CRM75_01300 [Enterococcus faecium]